VGEEKSGTAEKPAGFSARTRIETDVLVWPELV
jgi:hypothetical protein